MIKTIDSKLMKTIKILKIIALISGTVFLYIGLSMLIGKAGVGFWMYVGIALLIAYFGLNIFGEVYLLNKESKYDKNDEMFNKKKKGKLYVFDVINHIIMVIFMLICLFPIVYVLAGSFNQGADYSRGGVVFFPRAFTFENYLLVFKDNGLFIGFRNTVIRTILGTVLGLLFTALVSYGMSRKELKFKNDIYTINIITMFFSGGLIPFYLFMKQLHLENNFLIYIIPNLYGVYNMLVISSFFRSIPEEIHESATLEGASEFRIFASIYLPFSKAVLATVALWIAVGHWNSFFDTMIYTRDDNLVTLQYYLLKVIKSASVTEGMPAEMIQNISSKTVSFAAIILSVIPIVCVLPTIQKNFSSGIAIGSLKG